MKLECLKEKLTEGISLAEKISSKNINQPILNNLLLYTENRVLKVRSTNLDLGIEISIPARVEETGKVLVPARVFSNLLFNLPNEQKVQLSTAQQHLVVATSTNSSLIKSLPDDDFPSLPALPQDNVFHIRVSDWLDAIRAVAYAASLSDIKPEIASVYLHPDQEGNLTFVATDSFRLAAKKITSQLKTKIDPGVLIPFKNITEIIRVLESIKDEAAVSFSKHQLAIQTDWLSLTTRLIDGLFPDYQQIIPTSHQTSALVAKDDLTRALKLAMVFSDRLSQVTLKISPPDNLLELTSQSDVGENTSQLAAQLSGENLTINFNLRYLLDCLPSLRGDNLRLGFNGKNRPILVTDESDARFRYLIMPLNR